MKKESSIISEMKYKYLVFIYLALFSACQKTSVLKDPGTLRMCFSSDPVTIDPARTGDFTSASLICLLYEGLTRCTQGAEVELALAERLEISPDGRRYVFYLRDAVWQDGAPVTAFDFVHSWERAMTPGKNALWAHLFYPIQNAEKFIRGFCSFAEVGVKAPDEKTLEVTLETPLAYFLALTAFPSYLPTPKHVDCPVVYWEEEKIVQIVANGPFYLAKARPGSELVLRKNPLFWNAQKIHLNAIHISIIPSELTALHLFDKGDLDLLGNSLMNLPPELLGEERKEHLYLSPVAASTYCVMNVEKSPFSNLHFRKALYKAIENHPILVREMQMRGQIAPDSLLSPSLYLPKQRPASLAEEKSARALFDEALEELHVKIEDLAPLTLYCKNQPVEKHIALLLQKIWAETLQLEVQIVQLDIKSLTHKLHTKDYAFALSAWIAQFPDPASILERLKTSESVKNYPGWYDEAFEEKMTKAALSSSSEKRAGYLSEAEKILVEKMPLFPLYHWNTPTLVQPQVKNLKISFGGGLLVENCKIIAPESSFAHR